jgi:hypothetical protein
VKFCQPHWDTLRAAIKDRGLSALIAESGQQAVSNMASELSDGPTIDNFDPLMSAMWAIIGNLSTNNPGVLFMDGCPLCYANRDHARGCTDPACTDRAAYYDRWIGRAADDQVAAWKARGEQS